MKALMIVVLTCGMLWTRPANSEVTVNVLVIGADKADPDGVRPTPDAKVRIVPEDGRTGLIAYTGPDGRATIQFPSSRSFVVEVTAGPIQHAKSSRMYGRVDHNISIYMGPTSITAYYVAEGNPVESSLGDTGLAILSVAEDAASGLPIGLKQKFLDEGVAKAIRDFEQSPGFTSGQSEKYWRGLEQIRNAPELAPTPAPPSQTERITPAPPRPPRRLRNR